MKNKNTLTQNQPANKQAFNQTPHIMKKITKFIVLSMMMLLFGTTLVFGQTTYTWNQTGTASYATASNWTPTRSTPATNDILVFDNGATTIVQDVTTETIGSLQISGNTTVTLQPSTTLGRTLTINNASTGLTISSGSTLIIMGRDAATDRSMTVVLTTSSGCIANVSGTLKRTYDNGQTNAIGNFTVNTGTTLNILAGGTYEHNIEGGAIPTATWNATSTCLVTGVTAAMPSNKAQTFGNFTWNCPNQNTNLTWTHGAGNIAGTFEIVSTGSSYLMTTTNETMTGTFKISGGRFITNVNTSDRTFSAGSLTVSGGSLEVSNTSGSVIHTFSVSGNVLINGGTLDINKSATNAGRLLIGGNLTLSSGALAYTQAGTTGSSGVYFNGTGAQTFTHSGGTLSTASGGIGRRFYYLTSSGPTALNEIYSASALQTTINGSEGTPAVGYAAWPTSGALINNVTINNSAGTTGVTLSTTKTVNGTLTLNSGAFTLSSALTMASGSTIIRTGGSLSTTPTFVTSTNVTYGDGSYTTAITTGAELPTVANGTLNNLTINVSGGVTLNAATTLKSTGTLTLTNGVITTTSTNTLTVSNTAAGSISGGSSSSFVYGPLDRAMVNTTNYFYPVGGNTTNYRPITLKSVDVATPVVRVTVDEDGAEDVDGTTLSELLNARNWLIEQISGSFTSATLEITEDGMTNGTHEIGKASTNQAGTYATTLCGSPQTVGSGVVTSNSGQTVGYYAIGIKAAGGCVNPTDGGTIAAAQTICYNGDPAAFTSSGAATGHTGTLEYKWQYSTDVDWTSPQDIASSNSATYDAPTGLTADRWYRRLARVSCESDWSGAVVSNVIKVTVRSQFTAGTILATGETICSGSNPSEIGSSVASSGGDASITYKWQYSADVAWTSPQDIGSSNSASYDPAALEENRWYRRLAVDGTCNTSWETSTGVWAVTVQTGPTAPTSITGTTTICNGSTTVLTAAGGSAGSGCTYEWGTGESVGSNIIGGATSISYTTAELASNTTYWVRRVGNTNCTNTTGGTTQLVTVNAIPAAPTGDAGQTFCAGTTVASLSATGDNIKWYAASSGGSAKETTEELVNATHYYASQTVTSCESSSRLDVTATVNAAPAVTVQPSAVEVCDEGGTGEFSVTATGTSLTYQWQESSGGAYSNISDAGVYSGSGTATLTITNPAIGLDGYTYKCVVSGACTPSATSDPATMSVNAAVCFPGVSGDYCSKTTGNWADATSWQTHNGTTWIDAVSAPTSANGAITIRSGHTITVAGAVSVDQVVIEAGGQVTVNGGNLTIAAGAGDDFTVNGILRHAANTITTTGNIVFGSGSEYQHAMNGDVIPTATWNANSTCTVTGIVATAPTGLNQSFGNINWNCASQTAIVAINNTTFDIQSGATFTIVATNTGSVRFANSHSGSLTDTWTGSLRVSGGTFYVLGLNANGDYDATLTVQNLTIDGGTLYINGYSLGAQTPNVKLYVNGTLTLSSGTLDLFPSSTPTSSNNYAYLYPKGDFIWSGGSLLRTNTEASGPYATIDFAGAAGTQTFTQTLGSTTYTSAGRGIVWSETGGSTLNNTYIGTTGNARGVASVSGNITVNCTGTCSFPDAITVAGIFYMTQGTVTLGSTLTYGASASLVYNGTTQKYTGDEWPASFNKPVTINNAAGVVLSRETTTSSTFTLTNGILNTTDYKLIITNTATDAVVGGSTSSYVNGPLRRTLAGSLATGTYVYPVGTESGYKPFTISDIETGATGPVVEVQAYDAPCGGTRGIGVIGLSSTEYWYANLVSGNYTTGKISVTRTATLGDYDVIARSATLSGQYSSLTGTVSGSYSINTSDVTGSALGYFVVAEAGCEAPGLNAQYNNEEFKTICASQAYTLSANPSTEDGCLTWEYAWYTGDGTGSTYWDGTDWDNAVTWNSTYKTIASVSPATTTTYFVKVRCAATTTCTSTDSEGVLVTVNSTIPAAPTTDNAAQSFCSGETVANIEATGSNIIWYNASSAGSVVETTTPIADATHYYASQTVNSCESTDRLDVTASLVTFTLANAGSDQTVCATTATLAGNELGADETGLWARTSGTGTITTSSAYNSGLTDLGAGENIFTWTITKGSCSSTNSVSIIRETVAPTKASTPSPENSATGVIRVGNSLTWVNGGGGTSYDVYYGTVSPGTSIGNQTTTTYSCSDMAGNTVYYWRIDAINSCGTTTGDIWSFTTEPGNSYYVDDDSNTDDTWTLGVTGNNSSGDGSSGAPYRTITALLAAKTVGAGDVIYVDAGTYSETNINIGTSDDGVGGKYVTIKGAGKSLTIFNTAGTNNTFNFATNSVSYIKIMDLKATKNSSSYSPVSITGEGINNIWFENCEFTQAGNKALVYAYNQGGGTACDNIKFNNCVLTYSGTGSSGNSFLFNGRYNNVTLSNSTIANSANTSAIYFYSGVGNPSDKINGVYVKNNTITTTNTGITVAGVHCRGLVHNIDISDNTISNASTSSSTKGINLYTVDETYYISNPKIYRNTINTSGVNIYIYGSPEEDVLLEGLEVYDNNITNNSLVTTPNIHCGIWLSYISGGSTYRNKVIGGGAGINMEDNNTDCFIFNNYISNSMIPITTEHVTSSGNTICFNSFYGLGSYVGYFDNETNVIKNNIFYNNSSSPIAAIHLKTASNTLNNNLYYIPTGGAYGEIASSTFATLSEWKTATGGEANAQFGNPYYDNPAAGNLDITVNVALSKAPSNATPLGGYTSDIYTSERDATAPWIGAYENLELLLPIKLITFTASCENGIANIRWTTASEVNNDYFTLERSSDGINFEVVTNIYGAGNSSREINYEYFDMSPYLEGTYYRLKQTDYDGTTSYSQIISVGCKNTEEQEFEYVNMIGGKNSNNLTILFNSREGDNYTAQIFDVTGRLLITNDGQTENGLNAAKFDISSLSTGVYLVVLNNGYTKISRKVLLK